MGIVFLKKKNIDTDLQKEIVKLNFRRHLIHLFQLYMGWDTTRIEF